jgi:hypothetical protein
MDTEGDRGALKPSWLGHLCTTYYKSLNCTTHVLVSSGIISLIFLHSLNPKQLPCSFPQFDYGITWYNTCPDAQDSFQALSSPW